MTKINEIQEDSLFVNNLFFTDRWDTRLPVRAIFALLYVLDRTDSGRRGRYFEQCQETAHKEYGISVRVLAYGLTDLQRFNLIEKYYDKDMVKSLEPNGISLNPFYRMKDFEDTMQEIKAQTTPELMQITLDIADRINEPCDLNVLREIIDLGKQYGLEILKKCYAKIPRTKNSRLRQWPYLRQVIVNAGKGN